MAITRVRARQIEMAFRTAVESRNTLSEAEASELNRFATTPAEKAFLMSLYADERRRNQNLTVGERAARLFGEAVPPWVPTTAPVVTDALTGASSLDPVAPSAKVPESLRDIIKPTDEALDLSVLNREFNPLKQLIGSFRKPSQLYQTKAIIPTKEIFEGLVRSLGRRGAALRPMLEALPTHSVLRMPGHQFDIDGTPGTRNVFYGGQRQHRDLDKVTAAYGAEGQRLVKQMFHIAERGGQGGSPQEIMGDGVAGTTHAGGFSSGHLRGRRVSIKSDWPSNYGILSDNNKHYNANLYAIDYQGGVRLPIPKETLMAYKNNADMWDAALGMTVPFTDGDRDPRFTNYKYNPLDVYDQASAKSLAHSAASLDYKKYRRRHGSFYCAEGQYVVANLGPQEDTLLRRSNPKYRDSALGKLIDAFGRAPDLDRSHPERGWKHLLDKGLITQEQYSRLESTGRIATYLEWVPESIKGWQAYQPIEPNALVASPMTVAGLVWSLLRRFMPREGVAAELVEAVEKAYRNGTGPQKEAIEAMLQNNAPNTPAGQKVLEAVAFNASNSFLMSIINNPEFKQRLFHQAGFDEIESPADRTKLEAIYSKFAGDGQTPGLLQQATTQTELDAKLAEFDKELRNIRVKRTGLSDHRLMLYAAPQVYSAYAQQGIFSGGTNVFKYVATAQHEEQAAR